MAIQLTGVSLNSVGIGPVVDPGNPDPFYDDVQYWLRGYGTNGSTTFTDSSQNNLTTSVSGGTQISTSSPVVGDSSILFNGTNAYIQSPQLVALGMPSNLDWTWSAYIKITAYPSAAYALYCNGVGNNYSGTLNNILYITASGGLIFEYSNGTVTPVDTGGAGTIPLNTAVQVAITYVQSTKTLRRFIGGTVVGTTNITTYAPPVNSSQFTHGRTDPNVPPPNEYFFNGKMNEITYTRGVARWTANYTPEIYTP